MKSVSIITSAYNEEECLPELFRRINTVFNSEPDYDYKIIIADNASVDRTWEIISEEASRNPKISANRMSRTFPFDAALRAGLDQCNSDIAVIMTSDLQDPPEVIPELLRQYELGYDQVLVKITSRESVPIVRRVLSNVFYKIGHKVTDGLLPESVSDFRLLSKKSYRSITLLRENHSFLRGLSAWVGFSTTTVKIPRPPRFAGESKFLKFPLIFVIVNSLRSLFAYSSKPLIWISILGFFLSIFFFVLVIMLSVTWFIIGVPFAGFGSIIGLVGLGFSLIMLCLGVISLYIGLIYEEVKSRPLYIISENINPIL